MYRMHYFLQYLSVGILGKYLVLLKKWDERQVNQAKDLWCGGLKLSHTLTETLDYRPLFSRVIGICFHNQ